MRARTARRCAFSPVDGRSRPPTSAEVIACGLSRSGDGGGDPEVFVEHRPEVSSERVRLLQNFVLGLRDQHVRADLQAQPEFLNRLRRDDAVGSRRKQEQRKPAAPWIIWAYEVGAGARSGPQ